MKIRIRTIPLLLALAIAGCYLPKEETPTSGRLLVLASESQARILLREAEEFHRIYPDAQVTVLTTSTRDAIVQLLNDSVRCICSDRALNAEERAVAEKAGLEYAEIKIAIDAMAAVTHPSNAMDSIDMRTIAGILDGTITSWSAVPGAKVSGPLVLALPGPNSGTYELLKTRLFRIPAVIRPNVVSDSCGGAAEYVARTPGAFSLVPVSYTRDSAVALRVLDITAEDSTGTLRTVVLHQANVYLNTYPMSYPLYLYYTGSRSEVAAGFAAFVASGPGQKIFQNAGLVPATMPVRLVQLTEEQVQ